MVRLVAARRRSSRSARIWAVDFEIRGPARRRSSHSAGIWSVDFEVRGPARRRSSPLVAQC